MRGELISYVFGTTISSNDNTMRRNVSRLLSPNRVMFANDSIKRKMQDQASGPFILLEQLGAHTWKVIEEDTCSFVFHDRRLRKIDHGDHLPDLRPPLISSVEPEDILSSPTGQTDTTENTTLSHSNNTIISTRPRLDREQSFLNSISGPSRSGRVRRGSMNRS